MARGDLIALTDDGLVQLSNAGLVKRGLRELADGKGPTVVEDAGGIIEARFADGTVTRLGPGQAPVEATCTCPASGVCRHRVGLVLAYRAVARKDAPAPQAEWNPADLDLARLEASFTGAARGELQRLRAAAVNVRLIYGATPTAALPMATVRFLAPNDTALARCDCAAGHNCEHVVLAVEAFQAARGAAYVTIGAQTRTASDSLREAGDEVLARLLTDGVIAGMAAHGALIDRAHRIATTKGATWLVLALEALAEQIKAYEQRSALHEEHETLDIATELFARPRAQNAAALGYGEAMETPMSKTRLVSLGARVMARGKDVAACVAFFDTDTGATMLLDRTFAADGAGPAARPQTAASRHVMPNLSLGNVARGQLLTAVAKRRADGTVRFGTGGGGKTTLFARKVVIEPPPILTVAGVDALRRSLAEEPPRFLQPRNRTAGLRVFSVERVLGQVFEPGTQTWHAAVELTGGGGELLLQRRYDPAAPGAMECLSGAFDGASGPVQQISGQVLSVGGAIVCEPWTISADRIIVPDIDGTDDAASTEMIPSRPFEGGLHAIRRFLAGAVHGGIHRRDGAHGRALTAEIGAQGFEATANKLQTWLAAPEGDVLAFGGLAVWLEAMHHG